MINNFSNKYGFLSNFHISPFYWKNMKIQTTEHLYQAMKTIEPSERLEILKCKTPGQAKRLGSKCNLRPDWEERKEDIMLLCLRLKFNNPDMKELLLYTCDELLVESNCWHDNVWGNCNCRRCVDIEGKNMLGCLLMKVREELK